MLICVLLVYCSCTLATPPPLLVGNHHLAAVPLGLLANRCALGGRLQGEGRGSRLPKYCGQLQHPVSDRGPVVGMRPALSAMCEVCLQSLDLGFAGVCLTFQLWWQTCCRASVTAPAHNRKPLNGSVCEHQRCEGRAVVLMHRWHV